MTDKLQAEIISEKFGLSDRGPSGIDIVLDCSGAEVCIQTGMWLLKRRGKFIQVSSFVVYVDMSRGLSSADVGVGWEPAAIL